MWQKIGKDRSTETQVFILKQVFNFSVFLGFCLCSKRIIKEAIRLNFEYSAFFYNVTCMYYIWKPAFYITIIKAYFVKKNIGIRQSWQYYHDYKALFYIFFYNLIQYISAIFYNITSFPSTTAPDKFLWLVY